MSLSSSSRLTPPPFEVEISWVSGSQHAVFTVTLAIFDFDNLSIESRYACILRWRSRTTLANSFGWTRHACIVACAFCRDQFCYCKSSSPCVKQARARFSGVEVHYSNKKVKSTFAP